MNRLLITLLVSLTTIFSTSNIVYSQQAPVDRTQIVKIDQQIFTTRSQPKSLALPADTDAFQFAIYGDRTGGDPSGLKFLRQAVKDTNLIDPDFVMTVGDLIQGYNLPNEWMVQMKEFQGIMGGLKMSWFPVAGNHDIYWDFRDMNRPREHHESNYEEHFGPLWYSFQHKGNGFIVLYSDEGDLETGEKGFNAGRLQNMSESQVEFLEKALNKLAGCNQVFCFLHHPRWLGRGYEGSNWPKVHQKFVNAGNVSAVFAGHIHHMTYHGPVDNIEYYSLATTGGHLSMDSPELGYLHHFNLVTVRKDGFSVSAIPVGGVIDPKSFDKSFMDDVNQVRDTRPVTSGGKLQVQLNGSLSQSYSLDLTNPGKYPVEVTYVPQVPTGWQAIPDHQHMIVGPGKTEQAKFYFVHTENEDSNPVWLNQPIPKIEYSYEYLHPKSRIRLPAQNVSVDMELAKIPDGSFQKDLGKSLHLGGVTSPPIRRQRDELMTDSVRIKSSEIDLPQGPFTLEAWIYPTDVKGSRGVIAKTQSSEYAIFLQNGYPQFDVHLNGGYVTPKAPEKVRTKRWVHIAGVFDGNQCRIYVDGKKVDEKKGSGTRTLNQFPLFVGADPDGYGNPTREFSGQVDEVRLSVGARYDADFEPAIRHQRDEKTRLLLHFDQQIGPFVLDDSDSPASAWMLGGASVQRLTGKRKSSSPQ
ncbi:MAG: LamG-like jellyroll fold domain-containing protein [Planctomycetota bacterium]